MSEPARGRGWSWAALVAATVLWIATLPTWGASVLLSPFSLLLTGIAWLRSSRDAVLWIGLALNTVLVLILIRMVVDVLTGEAGVEFE